MARPRSKDEPAPAKANRLRELTQEYQALAVKLREGGGAARVKKMHEKGQLSPRERVVLIMLVEAHDKDKIADLLHLSPHTVKDYMKTIYKHFSVSSQLELIHRFRFGDRGDEDLRAPT